MIEDELKECFLRAKKEEEKGRKHKGLFFVGKDDKRAIEYVQKAKMNLSLCEIYKNQRLDYMIPEYVYLIKLEKK